MQNFYGNSKLLYIVTPECSVGTDAYQMNYFFNDNRHAELFLRTVELLYRF